MALGLLLLITLAAGVTAQFTPNGTLSAVASAAAARRPWLDPSLPVPARVDALLRALTTTQKILLLGSNSEAIPSRGVPAYGFQVECLHGMVYSGVGVQYAQPIAWAATFNPALVYTAASQVGDEMRALNNREMRAGRDPVATTCFGPHVHIARDPRWGRLSETYGEDPRLAGDLAYAFVTGLQGGNGAGRYLKAGATCKHFIGNDMEDWKGHTRHNFNAKLDPRDLRDTFLPPFQACVDAHASALMCAYNSVNGIPSCLNSNLLNDVLRKKMGHTGYVVTDCSALNWVSKKQPEGVYFAKTRREGSKLALQAGTDMVCHDIYSTLDPADVSRKVLDRAARRVLTARVRLGHFNPARQQPWNELQESEIGSPAHRATARMIVAQGSVLLKNIQGALPLKPAELRKVAVVGPFADEPFAMMGNYYSFPKSGVTTPLEAIRAALPSRVKVSYAPDTAKFYTTANVASDVARCQAADVCILFLGTRIRKANDVVPKGPTVYAPREEGETLDRLALKLKSNQRKLFQALAMRTTTKLVVVLVHGGPLDVSDMQASPRASAILTAWAPSEGAPAVADLLLGKLSPSGRLPVTWYRDSYTSQLPMTDMRMRASGQYPGRTHRYWRGAPPLYPFGWGLSYTTFTLPQASVTVAATAGKGGHVSVNLTNSGPLTADSVVLVLMSYVRTATGAGGALPRATIASSRCTRVQARTDLVQGLAAYQRSEQLAPGTTQRFDFWLPLAGGAASAWAGFGDPAPPCGAYSVRFGTDQSPAAVLVLA